MFITTKPKKSKLVLDTKGLYFIEEELVDEKNNNTNYKKKIYYFADQTKIDKNGNPIPDKRNIAMIYLTRGPTDIPYPWDAKTSEGVAVTEFYRSGNIWKKWYIKTRNLYESEPRLERKDPPVDCFLTRKEEFSDYDKKLIKLVEYEGVSPYGDNYCTHYIGKVTKFILGGNPKGDYYYFSRTEDNRILPEEYFNLKNQRNQDKTANAEVVQTVSDAETSTYVDDGGDLVTEDTDEPVEPVKPVKPIQPVLPVVKRKPVKEPVKQIAEPVYNKAYDYSRFKEGDDVYFIIDQELEEIDNLKPYNIQEFDAIIRGMGCSKLIFILDGRDHVTNKKLGHIGVLFVGIIYNSLGDLSDFRKFDSKEKYDRLFNRIEQLILPGNLFSSEKYIPQGREESDSETE